MYALDMVGELRDHNPFNYYSWYSDFRHTKRLLTQIFELQCEFDFINNGFYTYLEIDSTIEWRTFFEKELKKRNKDFKVLDRDFFNVIFSRVYDSKRSYENNLSKDNLELRDAIMENIKNEAERP